MNKTELIDQIKKNLYEAQTILSTKIIIKLLEKHEIVVDDFKVAIENYQNNIHLVEQYQDSMILKILNEKLQYFAENATSKTTISLYYSQIAIAMTFIKDKVQDILKMEKRDIKKEYQTDINHLNSIQVKNFYSIKDLRINNLQNKKEIYIVGENGDGKTLLLQSLVIGLKGVAEGDIFDITKSQKELYTQITFDKDIKFDTNKGKYQNLFAYGSNRNNSCKMNIDKTGYLTLFNNAIDLNSPIDWLLDIYNATKDNQAPIINLEKAKELIQELLNRDVEIKVSYNKVEFQEKGITVEFEQLSAGYRSVIIIICDLLKRVSQNQPHIKDIKDFIGIVLIDEVELHLHPKWKYEFISILRNILPKMQFIVTTHSPTVILGASKEAVFYKIFKKDGVVDISDQIPNKGYTNNTIISSPLFDLGTMASRDFDNSKFSSDDFIYEKIHDMVSKEISDKNIIDNSKIMSIIEKELANI